MKYNNVSVFQVISKVMMDLDISEEQQRISDYIEWAGEAVELIGAPVQLETITTEDPLSISRYQAQLPSNVTHVMSVEYCESKDGQYRKIFSPSSVKKLNMSETSEVMYSIKPGFININRRDGFVNITYKRLYQDSEGRPMIPDLMSYIEAVYWYIVMKITYPLWRIGKIRDVVYYDAKKSWSFFKNKAYGEIMMPTYDEYSHNVKNAYNRLMPEMNNEHNDFQYAGTQEKTILT